MPLATLYSLLELYLYALNILNKVKMVISPNMFGGLF